MWTRRRVRLLGLTVAVALVALGSVRLWQLGFEAGRLLESLGLPPEAYEVSPIGVQGPDGPMPEIATRSFRVRSNAKTLKEFYVDRCKKAGFSEPSPDSARLEGELLCERWRSGGVDWVLLSVRCERDDCHVAMQVHR
jgi:hypothetical protein